MQRASLIDVSFKFDLFVLEVRVQWQVLFAKDAQQWDSLDFQLQIYLIDYCQQGNHIAIFKQLLYWINDVILLFIFYFLFLRLLCFDQRLIIRERIGAIEQIVGFLYFCILQQIIAHGDLIIKQNSQNGIKCYFLGKNRIILPQMIFVIFLYADFSRSFHKIQNKLLLLLTKIQMSSQQITAPIGIDLGSWTSKIAVAKRGGVQIITNEANFRQTPCVVGYGPSERNIGEAGNIKMKSNFKDSVSFPMRFLGVKPDYPFLRSQKKFCPAKSIVKHEKVAFEVNYQGQKEDLYPQQIMAAYFNKLRLIVEKNGFENKSAVVAVPTYLTQVQRKAFFDAARIAQLQITRLINDSTAIALDYGMFRKGDLDAQNHRNVLFIDFGHSKLSIFANSFTKTETNVLEQEYCRHIGCRDIDYHLYEFYRSVFEKSSGGCDLTESKKATVKIMEYIEKQRKILSGITEHDLNIEYLMEENDLSYTMTRDQFEKISAPIFQAIREALIKVRDNLKAKNINLHSIELVGGGSRIPGFVHLVKETFGVEPSRTLNSSESVARGCALMAAIQSPLFKVPQFALNQKAFYGIKFSWNFVDKEVHLGLDSSLYPQKQQKMIYQIGAKIPTSKTIKFTRKQAIQILIQYQPSVNGFPKHIGYFVTKPQHPKEETFGVSFKIRYNENGFIVFDECQLVEEWFEETKIPKKKQAKKQEAPKPAADGSQPAPQKIQEEEFQIKKSKKQRFTAIKYDSNYFDNFTDKELEAFFTLQSTMLNQDRIIIQTYEKKNELESLAYQWKEKLLGTHQNFIRPQEIPPIIQLLQTQSEWLYNEGMNASRGVYSERIDAVKAKVNPVAKRYDNFDLSKEQRKNLEEIIKKAITDLNSTDKKYEHITPEDRKEGFAVIQKIQFELGNAQVKQGSKPLWQDLVLTNQQLKDFGKQIVNKVKSILSKPLPPPPKAEEKKEEKKEEKMDVQDPAKPANPAGEKMDVE